MLKNKRKRSEVFCSIEKKRTRWLFVPHPFTINSISRVYPAVNWISWCEILQKRMKHQRFLFRDPCAHIRQIQLFFYSLNCSKVALCIFSNDNRTSRSNQNCIFNKPCYTRICWRWNDDASIVGRHGAHSRRVLHLGCRALDGWRNIGSQKSYGCRHPQLPSRHSR